MLRRVTTLTTGRALCLLDIAAMALVWPLVFFLMLNGPARGAGHGWVAALLFPATNLVSLYALGLYRRDVGIELRKSLARIPAILNGHVAAWLSSCELGLDVRRRF